MNQGLKLDMLWQVGYRKGVNNLGKFEAQLSHLTPEKIWPDLNSLVSHLFNQNNNNSVHHRVIIRIKLEETK